MVMISDDGVKTPLITFCEFYQFHSWECWHWNVKKSLAENAKVGFNPTFAFSAEPVALTRWRQIAYHRWGKNRLRFAAATKTRQV